MKRAFLVIIGNPYAFWPQAILKNKKPDRVEHTKKNAPCGNKMHFLEEENYIIAL